MQDEIRKDIEQGKYFFSMQNYRKAEELFGKVLAKKKEFADVYNCMGLISHEKGEYEDAVAYFEKALKINPRYTEALLNLSILYNDMGEYDKAKKLVERSRKEAGKTKTAMDPFIRSKLANKHAEVGDWYRGVGAYEQAIEEYRKALELEDSYVDIHTKKAICHRELGHNKEAVTELQHAMKSNKRNTEAAVQLGVTYYAMGKKKDARKVWQDAARKMPQNKTIKMYLKFTD